MTQSKRLYRVFSIRACKWCRNDVGAAATLLWY